MYFNIYDYSLIIFKYFLYYTHKILNKILSWILIPIIKIALCGAWNYRYNFILNFNTSEAGFITIGTLTMVTFRSQSCVRLSKIRTVAANRRVWGAGVPHDGICTLSYHPVGQINIRAIWNISIANYKFAGNVY